MSVAFKTLLFISIFIQTVFCRQFVHTEEQLKLTALVNEDLNHGYCSKNDVAIIVHSAARSSGEYYEKRRAARDTWVKDAKALNISVIFAIALPSDDATQVELEREFDQYRDMVQFSGFLDDYWNLTLKAVAVAQWVEEYCPNAQFIVKLDDDVFVNVDRLYETRYTIQNGITGHRYGYKTTPDRDPESRYYMPSSAYPPTTYPIFISGLFYIMTKDIIYPLTKAAKTWNKYVLDFDDLYMTGIVGDMISLERHRSPEIVYREHTVDYEDCGMTNVRDLNNLIAYHGCTSAETLISMYNAWKMAREEDAESEKEEVNGSSLIGPSISVLWIFLICIVNKLFIL